FTATRELRNAFLRLKLWPLLLAPANPLRLSAAAAAWGSYYAHKPIVMGGRIADCLLRLR
ncbi:MAG TPA: thermostable hemolysin, partial [Burkholderiales bacterium]|nr:thermostable hemolysin [Burkholderiales bacterium]